MTFKNILNNLRPQLVGVVMVLVLFSCKKKEENPEPTGIEVQPTENLLGLFTTTDFKLVCTTQRIDSVRTDAADLSTVGSYVDPIFGKVSSSFVTQLRLSSENIDVNGLRNVKIDSAVLNLVYSGRYGASNNQSIEVFEVTEALSTSDFYYSSSPIQESAENIGSLSDFAPVPSAPITADGSLESPSIRIPIDTTFARKLFTTDASNYASNAAFTSFLNGIVVKPNNPTQGSEEGGLLYFSLPDVYSRLIVYYTNPDSTRSELAYLINDKSTTFNLSKMDYNESDVGAVLEQPQPDADLIYVQSFGGTMVKVETPDITKIIENGPVLVNYAKLSFSADISSNIYPAILNLFLFGLSEDETLLYELPDKGEVHYDGAINSSGAYKIGLTRYIQGVLDGKIENNGLLLRELGGIGARSIIYGPGNATKPLTLEISYTPISSETK